MTLQRSPRAVIVALLVTACHRAPAPAPIPVTQAAMPACPAPTVDTRGWQIVNDSTGLRYRLPAAFVERPGRVPLSRRWDLDGDFQQSVDIGIIESPDYWVSHREPPAPGRHEMSECIDSIPGRQILVQSWRAEGGVFRRRQRMDKYEVFALVPMTARRTVFLTGGGFERETQALLLVVARTIRVPDP